MSLRNLKFILFVFLIFALPLAAQMNTGNQGFGRQTYILAGLYTEGNEYVDTETIISLTGLRVGEEILYPADEKISKAVENLWKRKQFSNVEIIADRITPQGIFLKIQVEEYPRLGDIIIENNDKIDDYEIEDVIPKTRGSVITDYDVYKISKAIESLYSEEGMMFALVEADLVASDSASTYVNLKIYVDEGLDFRVADIKFEGNTEFDDDKLKKAFKETKEKSWWRFWRAAKFDKNEYKTDLTMLDAFYKREGFIDAEIIGDTVIYNEEEETVVISIEVNEGQRIFVRDITFEGNTVYPDYLLLRRLEFEEGDPYDVERFTMNLTGNENQSDASSLYLDNGYLQAQMIPKEIRVAEDSVDIRVDVYENERYTIGKVIIEGNSKTKDKVVRRELFTRPGEYFSRSAIIRSVRALNLLQYFNPETLKPDVKPSEVDATAVDIIYTVEERSTDTFNASVGFAGSFGLTGSVGFTFNNFSVLEPWKGGGGQIFNFNWEFGQINRFRNFSMGLTEPWLFDEPTTVGFNVFDSYINFSDIEQRRTGFGLNIGRRFRWPDDYWRGDWGFRYQLNDNNVESVFIRAGNFTEITLTQRLSRISINNMFFPTVGSRFSLSTNFAMGAIGIGETDYLKNEISFEMYNPLMKFDDQDRLVFALQTRHGFINSFVTDTTISPIELYRMGGNGLGGFNVTPLRGYPDNELGVRGGNKLLSKYTAELRFALSLDPMPVYVYGFAEAGNVWPEFSNFDPFDLKRSVGVGVQMMVQMIGNLGFSYGYGFDSYGLGNEVSGWRFLFHLGQQQ